MYPLMHGGVCSFAIPTVPCDIMSGEGTNNTTLRLIPNEYYGSPLATPSYHQTVAAAHYHHQHNGVTLGGGSGAVATVCLSHTDVPTNQYILA